MSEQQLAALAPKMAALRVKFQEQEQKRMKRAAENDNRCSMPVYDEVFRRGVEWLNTL